MKNNFWSNAFFFFFLFVCEDKANIYRRQFNSEFYSN